MPRESKLNLEKRSRTVLSILKKVYPKADIALQFRSNWELLVAVMLSAQSTDKQVNKVTKELFKKYRKLDDYVNADPKQFEKDIHSTGFFRMKTKHVLASAKLVKTEFGGEVPSSMEGLLSLPGVARKTANIVLGAAYGKVEGIAVDTHVKRLSRRLGFSGNENPDKIEKDLMKLFPQKEWYTLTYYLIEHGRAVCDARKPECDGCPLNKICPCAFKFPRFDHEIKKPCK